VVCSAETLLPKHRQLLEKTFNAHIINRNGTRELSTIAHECLFGTLHINEDWVYVEITDDRGRQVPNGQSGQVVLTGLYNDGMPFIRYAIQDIGSYTLKDEPCPCGCKFRALEQVEGRIQDLIVLPEGGYITGLFFPHLFKDYDVRQFQVLQPSLERLEIYLVPGKDFSSEDLESLRQTIARYTPGIQSSFQLVDEIPLTDSGKFRTTISHVAGAHVLHNIQAHEEKTPN
jgi:phenylacetate-CoA ligase